MLFGGSGSGGQMAFGDVKNRLAWAYVTNHQSDNKDNYHKLLTVMYDTVDKQDVAS